MTDTTPLGGGSPRVIVQFLEGGAASGAIGPDAAVTRLRQAGEQLSIDDVCLGWGLPEPLIEAVAGEARHQGAAVWLWHPFLSGDGDFVPSHDAAIGPRGTAVPPPGGMGEFAFDCPVRASGLDAAMARLDGALARFEWDGVFLDKIRWPSPTVDPAADLACFCDACRTAALGDGIDLEAVATALAQAASTPAGRLALVATLLRNADAGPQTPDAGPQTADAGPLEAFLRWRCGRITSAVEAAADLVSSRGGPDGRPMRVALDVFAPSLARSVGQDLAALAPLGEFAKAMLYLGTHGPAGMSYELCRLARWLADGGVTSPAVRIGESLGYPLPDEDHLCRASLDMAAFEAELACLRERAGPGAAAGIDAVCIDGLAVLHDTTLEEAVRTAAEARVAIVLSWDLWSIPPGRLGMIARALAATAPPVIVA